MLGILVVRTISAGWLLQIGELAAAAVITGNGSTVTVSVNTLPVQLLFCGVILYTTTAAVVGLLSVIISFIVLPLPEALNPVAAPDVTEAVHVKLFPPLVDVIL